MTKIQNDHSTRIVLGASFLVIISVLASYSQATYAQSQGKSTSTSVNTTSLAAKDISFSGKSVKILFASSLFDKTDWNNVDSVVSSGYDIKAVIPVQEPKGVAYFVVLELK